MEIKVTGSCHCGNIHFETRDNPKITVNCHCDDCKKRNGTAFSTYMGVAEKDFVITKGERYLKKYEVENSGEKYFCSECGSPIYNKNYRVPGLFMVMYGSINQPVRFTPSYNVFCSTKHDWVDSISNITSFEGAIEK